MSRQPGLDLELMSLTFKIRDFFSPRKNILEEAGIKKGFHVLDYGCGPGSYIIPLAEIIGKSGKIYALDVNPFAIRKVKNIVSKKHLKNVETICSDCETGLPDESMDMILLYDTLHDLNEPEKVLRELHRVLKSNGILSLSDHHMKENEIVNAVTGRGLFKLLKKGKKTYNFSKRKNDR